MGGWVRDKIYIATFTDLHKTCTVVLEVVELAQRHAYGCTLEVMASTKVESFLIDFLAGIKICMYEAMCDNAKCS